MTLTILFIVYNIQDFSFCLWLCSLSIMSFLVHTCPCKEQDWLLFENWIIFQYVCVWSEMKWKSLKRMQLFEAPVDYTTHGMLQARILEWVAVSFSRGSSQPRSPTLQVDSLPTELSGNMCVYTLSFCIHLSMDNLVIVNNGAVIFPLF